MMSPMEKVSHGLLEIARKLDDQIETVAAERVAFSLFVWTDGRCNYVSTADRTEIIAVLEGMIEKWKAGHPDIPAHELN